MLLDTDRAFPIKQKYCWAYSPIRHNQHLFLTRDNSWPTTWMMARMPGKSNRENCRLRRKQRYRCLDETQPSIHRTSHPDVFLRKDVLKKCSKFTGEHPCRNVISIKLLSNFIEIALWRGCSPVNLLHILRRPFPKNTSDLWFSPRPWPNFLHVTGQF